MKYKVHCPNHEYNKILFAYDSEISRFWIHCEHRDRHKKILEDGTEETVYSKPCNRWTQVDINEQGGIKATLMPRDYHLDFEAKPTLVEGV